MLSCRQLKETRPIRRLSYEKADLRAAAVSGGPVFPGRLRDKPKTPVKGQNEPNPVKAQGLPEAEPGCVPLLLIYTCGEPGSQVFQYYSATWNIQRNTLTQGQLFYTGHQLRLCARRLAAGASHL